MTDPTTNSRDIQADSIQQWDTVVKKYVDLRSSVTGLAPETLDTLAKIASSISNDPDYAAYVDGELAQKAPLDSPSFTGAVSGITKATVGLGNCDNTADAAKPVSTAQQGALDLKAPLASPNFTGTVGGVSKEMVGLGSVDNTSDAAKPVSTVQQTALDGKQDILVVGNPSGGFPMLSGKDGLRGLIATAP